MITEQHRHKLRDESYHTLKPKSTQRFSLADEGERRMPDAPCAPFIPPFEPLLVHPAPAQRVQR